MRRERIRRNVQELQTQLKESYSRYRERVGAVSRAFMPEELSYTRSPLLEAYVIENLENFGSVLDQDSDVTLKTLLDRGLRVEIERYSRLIKNLLNKKLRVAMFRYFYRDAPGSPSVPRGNEWMTNAFELPGCSEMPCQFTFKHPAALFTTKRGLRSYEGIAENIWNRYRNSSPGLQFDTWIDSKSGTKNWSYNPDVYKSAMVILRELELEGKTMVDLKGRWFMCAHCRLYVQQKRWPDVVCTESSHNDQKETIHAQITHYRTLPNCEGNTILEKVAT